jgi:hypothetical protein
MKKSEIGWIDFSDEHRQRVMSVIFDEYNVANMLLIGQ